MENDLIKEILCWDWIDCGNICYMTSLFSGGLFKLDSSTGTIEIFSDQDNWPLTDPGKYSSCIKIESEIILIPGSADNLGIYHIKDKRFDYYPIQIPDNEFVLRYDSRCKFFYGYKFENSVVVFPNSYPALLQMDLKSGAIRYHDEWIHKLNKVINKEQGEYYLGDGFVKVSDKLYLCLACCGRLLKIELHSMAIRVMDIGCTVDGFEGIANDGDVLYLVGRKEDTHFLIITDLEGKNYKKIELPFKGRNEWGSFLRPFIYNRHIYIMPYMADHCYSIEIGSGAFGIEKDIDRILADGAYIDGLFHVKNYKVRGNLLIFQTHQDRKWHEYNLDNGECRDFKIVVEDKEYWRQYRRERDNKILRDNDYVEEGIMSLGYFLDVIMNTD